MPTSRRKLFQNAGIISRPGPNLHKRTAVAWKERAEKQEQYFRSSFWAGGFPIGSEKHCGRKALYGLLNAPSDNVRTPLQEATAAAGHDVEQHITGLWRAQGMSIADDQLRLKIPELWMSFKLDAVLDMRPEWPGVIPADVKSKAQDKIKEMKVGARDPEAAHVAQICAYIYVCRFYHHEQGWDKLGLEPASAGFLYYVSRDNPSNGVAFWIEPDWDEMVEALATLANWKEAYVEHQLPPRPKSWRWTEQPCKWCDYKKLCKADYSNKVTDLFESAVVADGKRVDPEYNVEEIHAKVLKRWEDKDV